MRFELNYTAARERNLEAEQIVTRLTSNQEGGLDLEDHLECIASPSNHPHPVVRIRPKRDETDDEDKEEKVRHLPLHMDQLTQGFMLVVAAVVRAPLECGVFHRRGAEDKGEQPHRPLGLERDVREQPVITQRDTQARCNEHPDQHETEKPPVDLSTEVVEENRQANERAQHGGG